MARYGGWALGVVVLSVGAVAGSAGHGTGSAEKRPAGCSVNPATLTAPGCRLINSDSSAARDPARLWGKLDCAAPARHQTRRTVVDRHLTARRTPQRDRVHRRLRIVDGDDHAGQRCELGRNEHRYGQRGGRGTFQLYREGERRITFVSYRLLHATPIRTRDFQLVMQMKQTQPAGNGGGTPMLSLGVEEHRWVLRASSPGPGRSARNRELWQARARPGVWTRVALDVTYSPYARLGRVRIFLDRNGDGDASDRGERSRRFTIPTLKYETAHPRGSAADSDRISPGGSIPSHLRIGLYQNSDTDCSTRRRQRCAIAVDNVQVVAPR